MFNLQINNKNPLKITIMKALPKQKTKKNSYGETLVYNSKLRRWELKN